MGELGENTDGVPGRDEEIVGFRSESDPRDSVSNRLFELQTSSLHFLDGFGALNWGTL